MWGTKFFVHCVQAVAGIGHKLDQSFEFLLINFDPGFTKSTIFWLHEIEFHFLAPRRKGCGFCLICERSHLFEPRFDKLPAVHQILMSLCQCQLLLNLLLQIRNLCSLSCQMIQYAMQRKQLFVARRLQWQRKNMIHHYTWDNPLLLWSVTVEMQSRNYILRNKMVLALQF